MVETDSVLRIIARSKFTSKHTDQSPVVVRARFLLNSVASVDLVPTLFMLSPKRFVHSILASEWNTEH